MRRKLSDAQSKAVPDDGAKQEGDRKGWEGMERHAASL